MHRVELKVALTERFSQVLLALFLMHRVELKVKRYIREDGSIKVVPNAPCGVEIVFPSGHHSQTLVPNAPCGVESPELKLVLLTLFHGVPNAPCGVESCPRLVILARRVEVPNAPCGVERRA